MRHKNSLANLKPPFEQGNPGGPGRAPSAGLTLREWTNLLAAQNLTEAKLRKIAKGKSEPWTKRAAARRALATFEVADMADFEDILEGEMRLKEGRRKGLNTEQIKKVKYNAEKRTMEIELHDRAPSDFDRVIDQTEPSVDAVEKYRRVDENKATDRVMIVDDEPDEGTTETKPAGRGTARST